MKTFILKILMALFVIVAILTTLVPQAFAEFSGVTVKSIQVSGLGKYQGRFLTAIYANGSKNILSYSDAFSTSSNFFLKKIRIQKTLPILGDSVTFPSVTNLTWSGMEIPYNYVVLVIHPYDGGPGSKYIWVNSNGTLPLGTPEGNNTSIINFNALTKKDLDVLSETSNEESLIKYQYSFN